MTKLIIVRHCETEWNRKNKMQGQTDIALSKFGVSHAKLLAKRLSKIKIDTAYSSRMKRSVKTAEEILRFHKGIKLKKEKSLNEMSWGIFEGLSNSDIRVTYPELYKAMESDKFNFRIPNGESPKILAVRVKNILRNILRKNKDKTVLIVAHGGVNRTIIGSILKWSNEKILSTRILNGSARIINI